MTVSSARVLASAAGVLFALFMSVQACGGAAAGGAERATSPEKADARGPHESPSDDDAPAEEEAPSKGNCDDGTCSPCGQGLCPTGWYCDESAAGGPACSWLPNCVQKQGCGCLTSVLGAACKCVEQAGGLHVTCK